MVKDWKESIMAFTMGLGSLFENDEEKKMKGKM